MRWERRGRNSNGFVRIAEGSLNILLCKGLQLRRIIIISGMKGR